MNQENIIENIIIIGSGPAGLTAALYTARAFLNPLVIEGNNPGGQLIKTSYIENWPGEKSILGPQLMINIKNHALHFGTRFLAESIESVDFTQIPFTLITNKNRILKTKSVIIATGASPNKLKCPGEDEYWGKGVTTCAVCDGAFYIQKKVIIVGGGDTAMEDASFMTKYTNDITIVHIHDKLTASPIMQQRIINNKNIKIIYSHTITEITGNQKHITHATITDQKTNTNTIIPCDVIFLAIGQKPNTIPFKEHLDINKFGYINIHNNTQSSIPGIFIAGDVSDFRYRQAITSAGSGCMAALDAQRFLEDLKK